MKDSFLAFGLIILALLVGVGIFLYSTQPAAAPISQTTPSKEVAFTELAQGTHSKEKRRVNYLIQSTSELTRLWSMIDAAGSPPAIDFSTDSVIAVFAGEQPTLGHSIEVTRVEDGEKRKVTIMFSKPGGSCVIGQALTSPYQIVKVSKTSLSLTHETLTSTISCLQ